MQPNTHQHGNGCCCAGFELRADQDDDLFSVIDVEKVRCLNECSTGSCKRVLRPFAERNQYDGVLAPPSKDPELLINIPFKEEVKVRAVIIIQGEGRPETVGLWSNKENYDFSLVEEEEPINLLKLNTWTECGGIEVLTQYTDPNQNPKVSSSSKSCVAHKGL